MPISHTLHRHHGWDVFTRILGSARSRTMRESNVPSRDARGCDSVPTTGRSPGQAAVTLLNTWQAARARSQASIASTPSLWVRLARRWSPGLMPPLLGSLLLFGVLSLANQQSSQSSQLVSPQTVATLFTVYIVAGALYGLALYLAATEIIWLTILLAGAAGYVVLTFGITWGPWAGVFVAACIAGLVGLYARDHHYRVPDGRLAITTFAGTFARSMNAGVHVLAPGEKVVSHVGLSTYRCTTPTRTTTIPDEIGNTYHARASATVTYRILPAEAATLALARADWERGIHQTVDDALVVSLGEWGAHVLMGDDEPSSKLLARMLMEELRERLRPTGIHIQSIGVRDVWLAPQDELPPVVQAQDTPAPSAVHSGAEPMRLLAEREDVTDSEPDTQVMLDATGTSPTFSAEALSDAYEAVREGHILDPDTIRQIGAAFEQIATDSELADRCPFDASAAAAILAARADSLERGQLA